MMRRNSPTANARLISILLATLVAFVAGCSTTPDESEMSEVVETESEFTAPGPDAVPQDNVQDTTVASRNFTISPVYFDLDESTIRSEFEPVLQTAADALKDSGASVVIEGHCDERGSAEYNLALGERRAGAVRSYLYNLGVSMNQMSIVSYGEAKPAVSGSGESAWQLNRRAAFRVN